MIVKSVESIASIPRIYIGDDLVFDYSSSGIFGSGWHTYVLKVSTESVMTTPHQANRGKERQIVSKSSGKNPRNKVLI